MDGHVRVRRKHRRFMDKYGVSLFIAGVVVVILAVVAFVMVMLTSPNWRIRP